MRAIAASWLISGDPEQPPLRDAALVLDAQDRIVAVGLESALRARFAAAHWQTQRAVLLPGLINAHTHLELSALRGKVPGGHGFAPWVTGLMQVRDSVPQEALAEAVDDAVSELLRAGTVALGEVSNTLAALPALAQAPLLGWVFHEVFGLRREVAEVMLGMAEQQRREQADFPARLSYALCPHTPYSLDPEILQRLCERARAAGLLSSLHLCEHAAERAFLRDGGGPFAEFLRARGADAPDFAPPGLDPIRYVSQLGALGPHLLCVHLTDARPDEIALLASTGSRVVLCPRSNLHIELRLPPLHELLAAGIRPALGTDSLASNASLDVLEEARALHARFPQVAARTLLAMATRFGAEALGLQSTLGTLEVGKRPGVIAFPHQGPAPADPERFVLSAQASRRDVLAGVADV